MGTKITKENVKAAIRDDKAHMDYLKRDVLYDDHHGHSDEKMTADEKHISKLAGDVRHDHATMQGPAKHGEMHDGPMKMGGSFMSKHATNSYFHKQNLLDDMPVDDHASGLHMEGPLKQSFQSFRDTRPEVSTMNEMTWSDDLKRERRMPGFAETPTGGVQRAATENMAEAKKNRVENAIKGEVLKKKINKKK